MGAAAATLRPLVEAIHAHVFAADRIHADDTTVPVLAKGKTHTGRLWTYVRDDRPFGGHDPPAAAFFYSRDRGGQHPELHLASYAGLMQADAYAGFNRLYETGRKPGPIIEAMCWGVHSLITATGSVSVISVRIAALTTARPDLGKGDL